MTPADFPEAKTVIQPPDDLFQEVRQIKGFVGSVVGGSLDGIDVVVVAWQPDAEDLRRLQAGGLVFLTCFGGLPPHLLATTFKEATTL